VTTATALEIRAHGRRYEIENPGGLIGRALQAGVPYEAKVLEHIYRLVHQQGKIREGALALDVGASVGNHSLWLAAVCGLQVRAFEPLVYGQLERNVELNDLGSRIGVYPYALGARDDVAESLGRGELRVGEGHVPVHAYDDLDAPPTTVALVKIDVEGMECAALLGMAGMIRRDRPRIFAEARDERAEVELRAAMGVLGYVHRRTYGATPLLEWIPA
jgi:FkbM family methyltransferase